MCQVAGLDLPKVIRDVSGGWVGLTLRLSGMGQVAGLDLP